jgi:type I restriction enzyme M protein
MYQLDGVRYDKVFSNFPFGVRMALSGMGEEFISRHKSRLPKYGTSGDSVFSLLVERLVSWSPSAKGIAVVPNGFTWNASDLLTRRSMIENGMIEAVIALPEKLFESFSIPVALVVFNYAHEKIRMVDATKVFSKGRRQNYFSAEDIEKIVYSLSHDSEISRMVSYEELSGNEFALNPVRYFNKEISFENGIRLGDLLSTGVIRGAQLSADKLDELISHKETEFQYLMLSNIQNGMITDDLPYLKSVDTSLKKYCLKDNDLIISKNGYPFKIAIVHPEDGKTILANGNLFIVRTDQSKLNPVYLKAFLESEKGTDLLKGISVGSTIPNISQKTLEGITIPVPPVEEQNEIAEKYTSVQDEILILQNRLAKAISKLKEIL